MPKYKVTDSVTGKSFILTGDSPPTEQELQGIFGDMRQAQPPPPTPVAARAGWDTEQEGSAAKRAIHGVWDVVNPVNLVSGVAHGVGSAANAILEKGLLGATVQGAKNLVDAQSRGFVNAWDEASKGHTIEALGQAASGALPILGPIARGIGEEAAQTGDLARAVGRGVGLGLMPEIARKTPENIAFAGSVARKVAGGSAKAIPNPRLAGAVAGLAAGVGAVNTGNPVWALVAAERSAYFTENMLKRMKASLKNASISPAKRAEIQAQADAFESKLSVEKQALEELRQKAAVEDKVLKSDVARESKISEMDRSAADAAEKEAFKAQKQISAMDDLADRTEIARQAKMAKMDRPKNLRSIAKNGSRPEQERGTLGSIAVSREFARGENPAGLPAAPEAPRSLPRPSGAIEKADPSLPLSERAEINLQRGKEATSAREARSQEIGAKTDASGWGDTLQMISEMKQIVKGKKFDRAAYDALPDKYKKTFTFSQARLFAEQAK